MQNLLEDFAAQTIADKGLSTPVSAFDLALALGLSLKSAPIERALYVPAMKTIAFSEGCQLQRQHALVASRCAWFVLEKNRLPVDASSVGLFGAALLVPSPQLSSDLMRVGVDLNALASLHPNASKSLLAGRIAEMLGGAVSVWDGRGLLWWRGERPSPHLSLLVRAASSLACSVDDRGRFVWPIGDGFYAAVEA